MAGKLTSASNPVFWEKKKTKTKTGDASHPFTFLDFSVVLIAK